MTDIYQQKFPTKELAENFSVQSLSHKNPANLTMDMVGFSGTSWTLPVEVAQSPPEFHRNGIGVHEGLENTYDDLTRLRSVLVPTLDHSSLTRLLMDFIHKFLGLAFVFSAATSAQEINQGQKGLLFEEGGYNYKSACIFTDFLIHSLPPLNQSLINSKNTFELANTWLSGIYGHDKKSKYYVTRTKYSQIHFIKTSKDFIFHDASIQAISLPPEYLKLDYLSWIFDFKKEFLVSGKKKIGCENYEVSFEFSPIPEQKLIVVNINSFIE